MQEGRKIRVLYADDDAEIDKGEALIREAGYDPDITRVHGFDKLVNSVIYSHDMIIMECMMENDDTSFILLNGLEAIDVIRGQDKKIPILMLTNQFKYRRHPTAADDQSDIITGRFEDGKEIEPSYVPIYLPADLSKYSNVKLARKYPTAEQMGHLLQKLLGV